MLAPVPLVLDTIKAVLLLLLIYAPIPSPAPVAATLNATGKWSSFVPVLVMVTDALSLSLVVKETPPPYGSRMTRVLGVAAVVPAVAPLTAVPSAEMNPVRFDDVEVVTVPKLASEV